MTDANEPGASLDETDSLPDLGREDEGCPPLLDWSLLGSRPAGSDGEALVARRVVQAFHAAATPAMTLPARIPITQDYAELVSIPLLLFGILIGLLQPVLGILALALVLGVYAAETAGEGFLARVVPKRPSMSVLAAIPAQRRELRRLLVVASLDTPASGVIDRRPLNWLSSRLPRVIAMLSALAIALLAGFALDGSLVSERWSIIPAAGLVAILLLVAERSWVRESQGSPRADLDTLSPLVEFGTRVRSQPARWVDVWCFAAGGGSISGEALRQFIRDNELAQETTYIINIGARAGASANFALAEGPLWKRRSAPALVRILSASASGRPAACRIETTQAAVAIGMGFQAITIGRPSADDARPAGDSHGSTQLLLNTLATVDNELVERNRLARLAMSVERRPPRAIRPPQV